ncbi:MAG: phospholipase A [Burkholderiaceae bacterium]
MRFAPIAAALAAAWSLPATSAEPADCRSIADDGARLACYDAAMGRSLGVVAAPATAAAPAADASAKADSRRPFEDVNSDKPQTFAERWELDAESKDGVFKIKPYEPVYVLPAYWRRDINRQPCSSNPINCSPTPIGATYGHTEIKFQLSLKTKVWQDILGSNADLWAAYTQRAFWQAYDNTDSSPFTETDYQPETWLTIPLKIGPDWFQWRMVNLGLVHQSNGQTNPLSRSWNRAYAMFGFTSGDLSLTIKPWWRFKETLPSDNNPDITDYTGRMEVRAVYPLGRNVLSATLRNNLKFNHETTPNRSFVQAEWAFPLYGNLHGYVQGFYGWGETLQNYNFRNTGVGIGVSLVEWR